MELADGNLSLEDVLETPLTVRVGFGMPVLELTKVYFKLSKRDYANKYIVWRRKFTFRGFKPRDFLEEKWVMLLKKKEKQMNLF